MSGTDYDRTKLSEPYRLWWTAYEDEPMPQVGDLVRFRKTNRVIGQVAAIGGREVIADITDAFAVKHLLSPEVARLDVFLVGDPDEPKP